MKDCRQLRALPQGHRMGHVATRGLLLMQQGVNDRMRYMLDERTPGRHIEHLHAPAYAKEWHIAPQGFLY